MVFNKWETVRDFSKIPTFIFIVVIVTISIVTIVRLPPLAGTTWISADGGAKLEFPSTDSTDAILLTVFGIDYHTSYPGTFKLQGNELKIELKNTSEILEQVELIYNGKSIFNPDAPSDPTSTYILQQKKE